MTLPWVHETAVLLYYLWNLCQLLYDQEHHKPEIAAQTTKLLSLGLVIKALNKQLNLLVSQKYFVANVGNEFGGFILCRWQLL